MLVTVEAPAVVLGSGFKAYGSGLRFQAASPTFYGTGYRIDCFYLLMIEILLGLIHQNFRNSGPIVNIGSCRISIINSRTPIPTLGCDALLLGLKLQDPGSNLKSCRTVLYMGGCQIYGPLLGPLNTRAAKKGQ